MTHNEFWEKVREAIDAPVPEWTAEKVMEEAKALRVTDEDRENTKDLPFGDKGTYYHIKAMPIMLALKRLFPSVSEFWYDEEAFMNEADDDERERMSRELDLLNDTDIELWNTEYMQRLERYADAFFRIIDAYDSCIDAFHNRCGSCTWHYEEPDGRWTCKAEKIFGTKPMDWNLERLRQYLM